MADFIFREDIAEIDPDTASIIGFEEGRQLHKLILIPSESLAPPAVLRALGSAFNNVYAEGYPHRRMAQEEEARLTDFGYQAAYHRRYGDRRYYKGTEFADFIEALAQRRAKECFANDRVSPEEIYVNIQPLSGAAANNGIYEALVKPGDVVMGMSLVHGGHLTHGSELNISGKYHRIVSYGVDPRTERLDYEAIKNLAVEHRPRMIIAGYTSYPWQVDWQRFREAAAAVPGGPAILMADIAHPAGMVIAGAYPSPVGIADVITLTTHKTICGPRGAMILTTNREYARLIDRAIFPGQQGGPHVNKFAAIAVALKIARTERFRQLQHQIVANARHLAEALQGEGLKLAYGGTDTHLLLVDLNALKGAGDFPLKGEVAARVLDLAGIVCNKNTIPGDTSAADASGIRLGTPWVTQRGMREAEMERLAHIMAKVLKGIRTFRYVGRSREVGRGKIELKLLAEAAEEVEELAREAAGKLETESDYACYWLMKGRAQGTSPLREKHLSLGVEMAKTAGREVRLHYGDPQGELAAAGRDAVLVDLADMALLEIRGERAGAFLQEATTGNILSLEPGEAQPTLFLSGQGELLADGVVLRLEANPWGEARYLLAANARAPQGLVAYLRSLSDGYTIFDREDIFRKVQGPAVVEGLDARYSALGLYGPKAEAMLRELTTGGEGDCHRFRAGPIEGEALRDGMGGYILLVGPGEAAELWELLLARGREHGLRPVGTSTRNRLREEVGLPPLDGGAPVTTGEDLRGRGLAEGLALHKPYFIGQAALLAGCQLEAAGCQYEYRRAEPSPRRSALYQEHIKLVPAGRLVNFANWLMPVWYTRISEEHQAVRRAAGLFDVSHMGVLEVAGRDAQRFLDLVTTNYVPSLASGSSHYSYVLAPDGRVLDDILVYSLAGDRYMLVVNAVNAERVLDWLRALQAGEVVIDQECPWRRLDAAEVAIRDLKDASSGVDRRVDLALQGPRSLDILRRLVRDGKMVPRLGELGKFRFFEGELAGIPALISRSGYTGEEVGFELYAHPEDAPRLWREILDAGRDLGLKPAALGARDSTRTEAGLPLHGHELAGENGISPLEAGYGAFVKFHKAFFIGRSAMLRHEATRNREVVRFRLESSGARAVRPGDPVVGWRGEYLGVVTSAVLVEGVQMGMALVERGRAKEGDHIGVFPLPRGGRGESGAKPKAELAKGDSVLLHEPAVVLSRFPTPAERGAWGRSPAG